MSVGACQGEVGGGVGDRRKPLVADAAAGAALTGRAVCVGALGIRRARKNGCRRACALPGAPSPPVTFRQAKSTRISYVRNSGEKTYEFLLRALFAHSARV